MTADTAATLYDLPLFPLKTVLFPGGLLSLKVFEARYVDLIGWCLREKRPFGAVALRQGGETRSPNSPAVQLESTGCEAEVIEVDAPQTGILQVRCRGTRRFEARHTEQHSSGLWMARVMVLDADPDLPCSSEYAGTSRSLSNAIAQLKSQGVNPFLEPYRFDLAGWVANRWCELLPIPQQARQRLMELPDPIMRLKLVDEYLRSKGLVT